MVGSVESISKLQDTSLNLKAALYTKTGYTQTGWSLSEGGEKTYDLNGEYKENEAIKLYPYWSKSEKPTETASAKPGQTAEPTETTEPNETTTPTVSPNSMVKLNKTSVVLYLPKYKTFTLIAKVDGKSVKANFKSSNPKIVKVNAAGKLTAVKSGKAVVKVTVNGKKFICKVTVKKISLKIKPVKRTLYLKGNKSIRLKTIVTGPYRKVRYKSSNKNIVKVNGKGKVTAVRKGKAKITVTANGCLLYTSPSPRDA